MGKNKYLYVVEVSRQGIVLISLNMYIMKEGISFFNVNSSFCFVSMSNCHFFSEGIESINEE